MQIIDLETSKLIPYEFNNRRHNEQQINRIANSIKEFGFNQPLVIDEANIVLVGHGRLHAALKLGLKTVPVLRRTGLSEAQKKAYRILDNKLQNDSEWDWNNIELELGQLEDLGFELEPWGLDELLPKAEEEATEDAGPGAIPDEPFIKRGDIIELGPHRVMCGDSMEAIESEEFKSSDAILTDPPYGIGEEYESHEDSEENWLQIIAAIIVPMIEAKGRAGITTGVKQMFHYPAPEWTMAWINEAGTGMSAWGFCCWQPLLVYGPDPYLANGLGGRPDIFKGNIASEKNGHPCPKPFSVWAEMLARISLPGEKIFDPFLGSGTTLIAADQLGRICYGMEISPKYCQVILERYQRYCADRGKECKIKINGEEFKSPVNTREYKNGEARA